MGSLRGDGARHGVGVHACVRVRVCAHYARVCWAQKIYTSFAIIATYAYMCARIAYPYAPETPVVTGFAVLFQLFAKENFFE